MLAKVGCDRCILIISQPPKGNGVRGSLQATSEIRHISSDSGWALKPRCVCLCVCVFSCVRLFNSVDCRPPVSSVHEISQARTLEWVAISFSRGSSHPRDQTHISCIGRQIFCYSATRETHLIFYPRPVSMLFLATNIFLKIVGMHTYQELHKFPLYN